MTIQALKQQLPDYAKDIKLNIAKVLSEEGSEGLTMQQIMGVALASAYSTKQKAIINAIIAEGHTILSDDVVAAAKAAATIMAMNNIYYRFTHLIRDKEYSTLPANLRMNVIGKPGIDKVDFELMSLAVSAINGCGMCMEAHVREVTQAGISKLGVQSAIRIASVVNALAQVITIEE